MANVYLLSYMNYYNRKILNAGDNVADYGDYIIDSIPNVNFNPNDGVDTTLVINYNKNGVPDYLLVADSNDVIISRWFIMEAARTRGGQFSTKLRRDLIADYQKTILSSDCMIDRGWVQPNNNLVFNSEGMTYNQIKKDEILLKNDLGTPWVVAYLARTASDGSPAEYTGSFGFTNDEISVDFTGTTLEDFSPSLTRSHLEIPKTIEFHAKYAYADSEYEVVFSERGVSNTWIRPILMATTNLPKRESIYNPSSHPDAYSEMLNIYNAAFELIDGYELNAYTNYEKTSQDKYNQWAKDYWHKIIYFSEGVGGESTDIGDFSGLTNYCEIQSWKAQVLYYNTSYNLNTYSRLAVYMSNIMFDEERSEALESNALSIVFNDIDFRAVRAAGIYPGRYEYEFGYSGSVTKDAAYEIIATPLFDVDFEVSENNETKTIKHNGALGFEWFQNIAKKYYESGYCYDVQIVPYIEFDDEVLTGQKYINLNNEAIAVQLQSSSFSKIVQLQNIPMRNNIKISSEVDLYRIVSPNGVGQFDFSIVKNGGLDTIEIDVTLIPINPYIKINPRFGRLYGGDYNDFRGLVCGGDFSAPIVSSQWETYQINNKYYQQVFDRETQTLELQNKYSLIEGIAGAASGAIAGAASGATAGSMVYPGVGTAAGAIAGFVASAAAGIVDVVTNEKMRQESLSLRSDMFASNLQTIQARATTLSKSTAYNINNKYFPYIEYYSCSDEELSAIEKKLKYTSMKVGVIGSIKDFLNYNNEYTFIQCRPVLLEGLGDDYHTALEIAKELSQGVYIYSYIK